MIWLDSLKALQFQTQISLFWKTNNLEFLFEQILLSLDIFYFHSEQTHKISNDHIQ